MRLIKNEWIKLWSQKNAWVMLIVLVLAVVGFSSLNKYFEPDVSTKEARVEANEEWLSFYKSMIEEPGISEEEIAYYEEEIQKTEYRIANDLISEDALSAQENMEQSLSLIAAFSGIFMIVVAASIVSSEFGTGTVKMLLTRPVARWKVLLSKLLTTILYGLMLIVSGVTVAAIVSYILFPGDAAFTLSVVNGEVVKEVYETTFVETMLYALASNLMMVLFAFMLGSVFGSSTLAVSLALVLTLMGSTIMMFLAQYDFAKFIWIANDFAYYAPGSTPMIEELTFGFSLVVNIVYAVIFLAITFGYFTRRDITA